MSENINITEKLVFNGSVIDKTSFLHSEYKQFGMYYEVMRVINGKIAFLHDHVKRMQVSLKLANLKQSLDAELMIDDLRTCIENNMIENGNIRFSVYPDKDVLHRLVEPVPHFYPTKDEYSSGIAVAVVRFVRENPNVKKWNQSLKDVVKRFKSIHHVYEVLMYDHDGLLTEGSQSNLFFIVGNTVVTAPDDVVLKGITRDYVLKAIESIGLTVRFEAVPVVDVLKYDAVFITGTSPKVLPVREILSCCHADINHPVLRNIMLAYDKLLFDNLD